MDRRSLFQTAMAAPVLLLLVSGAHAQVATKNLLEAPASIELRFGGIAGARLDAAVAGWLLPAPAANPAMIEMFHLRDRKPVPQLVPWAGEFIGKFLLGAINVWRMTGNPALKETIETLMADFLATQAEDGYLGPFTEDRRLLGEWDLWGHYHAILALLLWHERTGDARALEAARRAGDLVCRTYLNTERRPKDAGSHEMNLAIIHGLGRLCRATGEARYLEMMRVIEEDWKTTGDYFRQGLAGVPFHRIPLPRWESLHNLEGLQELYLITGNEEYKTAFLRLWESIRAFDRHNTGGFSTGEQAIGNPYTGGAIETCCTVAWMHLTRDALQMSGDVRAADELEWSLFNGMMGAQHPSGRWWTYDTPMNGRREASQHTIVFQARAGSPELNCCSANAARGLGVLAEWAVMRDESENVYINYYGPMNARVPLADGSLEIVQEGDYPREAELRLRLTRRGGTVPTVYLRIPAWSAQTRLEVNGVAEAAPPKPGTYHALSMGKRRRVEVKLELDFTTRTWLGNGERYGKVSLYRGPLLLAYDQRDNSLDCGEIPVLAYASLAVARENTPEQNGAMALFSIATANGTRIFLRDFASAGMSGTEYRSWLPVVHAPPPGFWLLQPTPGGEVPPGANRFAWYGPRRVESGSYRFEVARDAEFTEITHSETGITRNWTVATIDLADGARRYWRVCAVNAHGETCASGAPGVFVVNAARENKLGNHSALLHFREDGMVTEARLDGDGKPVWGYLEHAQNIQADRDRHGRAGGAVAFRGAGRLRYALPHFPDEDYTCAVWFRADALPARLAQLVSAWARNGDDPLRLVLDNGRLFARIEGGSGASVGGVQVERGMWTHAAVVKRGASLTLYVNGNEAARGFAPLRLNTAAADFALGGNPHFSGNEFFEGALDDFLFTETPLDAPAIRALAAGR